MDIVSWLTNRGRSSQRMTLDEYAGLLNSFYYNGNLYVGGIQQTLAGDDGEVTVTSGQSFNSLVHTAYSSNGVVFACMLARQLAFNGVRFHWQQLNNGRPSQTFGTTDLRVLERPWVGGTTQSLLTRMINDADLAGTAYMTRNIPLPRLGGDGQPELVRMRPDWVDVILLPRIHQRTGAQLGWRRVGYQFYENGDRERDPAILQVSEVAQFSPIVDPLHEWRGMSWLTPLVREVWADQMMTKHKGKFFEQGATPNMIIKHPMGTTPDQARKWAAVLDAEHGGIENAYKRLHIGGGADVTVIGTDLQQTTFKEVQGLGETRIAAAARVSPVIVGLSEGLQGSSLNAGNYQQARRHFADGTCHPLWQEVCGALSTVVTRPQGMSSSVRLWYDTREVPFLREDEKDQAEIQAREAQTIRTLLDAGFTPESVIRAVEASDWALLQHSGLFSVQLQEAGASPDATMALAGTEQ